MDKESVDKPDLGPGAAHLIFIAMEDLLEKLKLLNYDRDFLKKSSAYKPLSRTYFAQQTNPGEQFYMFTNLAAWLIQKTGNTKFAMPEEYDDPNATISGILNELRKWNVSIDFSPSRLKNGQGEQCIFVLNCLVDIALKSSGFEWKDPVYPKVEQPIDEEVVTVCQETDDDSDGVAEEEELSMDEYDNSDNETETDFLALDGLKALSVNHNNVEENEEEKLVSITDTDANECRMEVERVLPSLKIFVRQDVKDWRNHLEQISAYRNKLSETLKQLQPNLDHFMADITKTPLVKVKQALNRLQQEILAIDVATGVIEQSLLQSELRDKSTLQTNARDDFNDY